MAAREKEPFLLTNDRFLSNAVVENQQSKAAVRVNPEY